jgi:Tol biopolymer transport system component
MAGLIIGLVLICLITLAGFAWAACSFGWIQCGGGGDRIVIGMPNRNGEADLYLLRLGQDLERATLLAEDTLISTTNISYQEDGNIYSIGNYNHHVGGFIPGQKELVIWFENDAGEIFVQRQAINQDSPTPIFDSNQGDIYGRLINNGQDLFLNESRDAGDRCYTSINGAAADRITKGDNCYMVAGGAYVATSEVDNGETTLTLMELDGSEEVTILDGQENVLGYRVSDDGSRVAYISAEDEQQIFLLDGRSGEEIAQGEKTYNVLRYYFASQGNILIYIAENEDGEIELYLLDDAGSLLVASSLYLNANISEDGRYIVYMVGDEDGDETVFSYNISNGQNTEIIQEENLRFTLVDDLGRVLVAQQDGDDLTLYSAKPDGSDLITLYDDNNSNLSGVLYYPDRTGLIIYITNDDGETSLFYTEPDNDEGFFLLEQVATVEVKDVSPKGNQLLAIVREDRNDDPALVVLAIEPDQKPVTLDEEDYGFTDGVFTENGRHVIYTAVTGNNSDDYEIRQAVIDGEESPETLYEEAYLADVQWTRMSPFRGAYFSDTLESTSYCPGAPTITVGRSLEGSLSDANQYCYRFNANADQLLTFNVEADYDTVLELFDRAGYQLGYDDDSGPGRNPRLTTSLPRDGTYYIVVSAYGSANGSYTISMAEGVVEEPVAEEPAADAIRLIANLLTRGYITSADAIYLPSIGYETYGVLFWFDGTRNEQIVIDVIANSQGSQIDSYVYLLDANMQQLTSDDDSGVGYDSQIVYTLPATGRYYILVHDLGNNYGSESNYWFDILLTR